MENIFNESRVDIMINQNIDFIQKLWEGLDEEIRTSQWGMFVDKDERFRLYDQAALEAAHGLAKITGESEWSRLMRDAKENAKKKKKR